MPASLADATVRRTRIAATRLYPAREHGGSNFATLFQGRPVTSLPYRRRKIEAARIARGQKKAVGLHSNYA
jgi:hypothetical protein